MTTDENMTRRPIKSRGSGWAKTAAQWLARAGMRPNHISLLSVVFGCLAGAALIGARIAAGAVQAVLFLAAAVFVQLRLLCNLFDGMVAVEGGFKTKSGEIYNELPDRFSDALIFVGAGYSVSSVEHAYALGWLAAVLSVVTAYVRALGASAGASQWFAGPMAKPHRMALLTAVCVAMAALILVGEPVNLIHPALAFISIGCVITIIRRTRRIVSELESK